jgi:hypothetical protein
MHYHKRWTQTCGPDAKEAIRGESDVYVKYRGNGDNFFEPTQEWYPIPPVLALIRLSTANRFRRKRCISDTSRTAPFLRRTDTRKAYIDGEQWLEISLRINELVHSVTDQGGSSGSRRCLPRMKGIPRQGMWRCGFNPGASGHLEWVNEPMATGVAASALTKLFSFCWIPEKSLGF